MMPKIIIKVNAAETEAATVSQASFITLNTPSATSFLKTNTKEDFGSLHKLDDFVST